MTALMGIRREDKNKWEQRVPVIPDHISELKKKHQIQTIIQPSSIRSYDDSEYEKAGANVQDDLSNCPVIFAVKEIPIDFFESKKTYVFFSHTIKGQSYNMPMLKKLMELQCTLIDYEKVVDENNRRLIFFGRFAGIAGMVDTLWGFGKRLQTQYHIDTLFTVIKQTHQYPSLSTLKQKLTTIGKNIEQKGLPKEITPLVIGFAGYGNVSNGAQEIIDLLPVVEVQPSKLPMIFDDPSNKCVYKVVFKEEDMVKPIQPHQHFDLQDYYHHPEHYTSAFQKYLPKISILMNCIYWDKRYPRLLSKDYFHQYPVSEEIRKPLIVGDISVDLQGAIEPTMKVTTPDNPVFVYDPQTDSINDGVKGEGMAIMAVDNLPCELPKDSSRAFSEILWHFIPEIVHADYAANFAQLHLPPEIKNAVILHQGKLTPSYQYINKYL